MSHSMIFKQDIDKQQLSIFLRDLAIHQNVNLKHMIEDCIDIQKDSFQEKKKSYSKKKNVPMKKKEIIIREQTLKREKQDILDDKKKVPFYLQNMATNPFITVLNFKTDVGKLYYKFSLLEKLWKTDKKKYLTFIILLYYQLKTISLDDDFQCFQKIMDKVTKKFEDKETKDYLLQKAGHLLEPLNFWDFTHHTLDDWQVNVIQKVKEKKSVLVKAPTSSGKSFIAMAAGILHKKIVYICPANPVVYQVGAHFIYMGYKVHFLVDNFAHNSYDSKTNIFIGTPQGVEDHIGKIGTHFEYAVFDEIHNVNDDKQGDIYENIIKLLDCNFLALSATIKNIEYLQEIFRRIHPLKQIDYVEFTKRFINQQRWVWKENTLTKLHPLCAFSKIDETFTSSCISFTPNDCSTLWGCIEDTMDEDIVEGCSPDDYFVEDVLPTLDDCYRYELFLKNKLVSWNTLHSKNVQEIVDTFQVSSSKEEKGVDDMIYFMKHCKRSDMFPMIMFHTDDAICYHLYEKLFEYLQNKELEDYPYHYDILEKKQELYLSFQKKQEQFSENISVKKSDNSRLEKEEKMNRFCIQETQSYIRSMILYYEQKLKDIDRSDVSKECKQIQKKNLIREKEAFEKYPDFNFQDIFKKHPEYVFTIGNEPMSAETIREVRREIYKTLNIKIPYEHIIFQMLKRGIGIYIETMPDEYNWIIQKLLSKKQIGIVISGKVLCLGIDLPIRTSVFLGMNDANFSKDEYLQMSGRAGRRGKDNQGNVIFYGNIDYLSLMNSELPNIVGNPNPIYETYSVLDKKYFRNQLFETMIHKDRQLCMIDGYKKPFTHQKLHWRLRRYPASYSFITRLSEIEVGLFSCLENDRNKYLLDRIKEVLQDNNDSINNIISVQKITEYHEIDIVSEYLNIVCIIHNELQSRDYLLIQTSCKHLFTMLRTLLFSYLL
jgi:hypothetical protein